MKVIMIGSHLRVTGGITRVVKNYLQAGIKEKVDLTYLPTYYGSNIFVNSMYYLVRYLDLFSKLNIFQKRYDVAHIHMSYKGSFIRKMHLINLLSKKNVPIILHMHGSQFKDYFNGSSEDKKEQIKNTLNKVSIIIALGKEWKEFYQSISNTKVVSLDNAVFPKDNNDNTEEREYITTMGVLSQRKGTYDLIKAAKRLDGVIDSKYKFLIAGDGEINKVKEEISKLGLEHRIIIPGWISDQNKIDDIYNRSILYVLPSYNEGMPMSILEAMSYGLPVISTDVGSIPSVIKEENGVIIKPGDSENLANSIKELLDDKQKVLKYKEKNTKLINTKYNVYKSIDRLFELYQDASK